MSKYFQTISTPVGNLHLVADSNSLYAVTFDKNWKEFKKMFDSLEEGENFILKQAKRQLAEYFKGKRSKFDLPIALTGTPFQKKVWASLEKIPYGKTRSYKEQATLIRSPKAVRAVGSANGKNPLCIVLPCHRVIGSNGSLTGYGGGLANKKILLELESSFEN